jgi:hypothetical protein
VIFFDEENFLFSLAFLGLSNPDQFLVSPILACFVIVNWDFFTVKGYCFD